MPRVRRMIVPGVVYHLISRFVDRQWFITTDDERACYLRLLGRSLLMSDWRCLAFAVMSNHIHLALIAGRESLGSWTRRAHSPFADFMNMAHGRIGALFVRGPKSRPVAPERVGEVIAYIHNNPVRAGVVATAAASSWTSHQAYVGLVPAPTWLHVPDGLARAGFADPLDFDRWAADPARAAGDRVSAEMVDRDPQLRGAPGTARTRTVPVEAAAIVRLTAAALDLSLAEVRSPRKRRPEQRARQVAVRCATMAGLTGVEIASALGITQQGVSVIARRPDENGDMDRLARDVLARLARGA
jgi:hypothetical protein